MNNVTSEAMLWLGRGVSPIPAMPKTKMPANEWRIWQNRLPPLKTVEYWFRDPSMNLGVLCGGPSNLAIIDFDDESSYKEWNKDMIARDDVWRDVAKKTYMVKTSRGMHLYLHTRNKEQSRKDKERSIDIRCQGNFTIVPPSIHPSGIKYEAIGTPDNIITVDTLETVFPTPIQVAESIIVPDIFEDAYGFEFTDTIQELKRVPILSFVSQYTHMHRSGGVYWMGRCIHPNHEDKVPSFAVNTKTNRAMCYSSRCQLNSNKWLDIIDLYQIINHTTTKEAIRDLTMIYVK
jgi:hypothetical protein